jgi:glycosyltransferase involved in cell wall biosynthesis
VDRETDVAVRRTVRPHVGINAHLLSSTNSYRSAGVSRYVEGLLSHVAQVDPEGHYTVFVRGGYDLPSSFGQRHTRFATDHPWVRVLWEQTVLPWMVRTEGIEVLHSPINVQPFVLPCRGVVTITDLSFEVFPESFGASRRLYQRVLARQSARRADCVIAISQSTSRDLQKYFGVPRERIAVVYPGVGQAYRPVTDVAVLEEFRRCHSLPEKLILFVGTLEPRKNLVTLLRAFAQLKRKAAIDHKLVLAGGRGWLFEPTLAAIEELGLTGEVILPGYVPEEDLPLWYCAAESFVYPTLYEGFGLPPLEAMACGVPVAVSNASSLPEVVGDAALMVEATNVSNWVESLMQLCGDGNLRSDLRERGLARAQEFSWLRTATKTVEVYEHVFSGGE